MFFRPFRKINALREWSRGSPVCESANATAMANWSVDSEGCTKKVPSGRAIRSWKNWEKKLENWEFFWKLRINGGIEKGKIRTKLGLNVFDKIKLNYLGLIFLRIWGNLGHLGKVKILGKIELKICENLRKLGENFWKNLRKIKAKLLEIWEYFDLLKSGKISVLKEKIVM